MKGSPVTDNVRAEERKLCVDQRIGLGGSVRKKLANSCKQLTTQPTQASVQYFNYITPEYDRYAINSAG
jgi:hypothetical protein